MILKWYLKVISVMKSIGNNLDALAMDAPRFNIKRHIQLHRISIVFLIVPKKIHELK